MANFFDLINGGNPQIEESEDTTEVPTEEVDSTESVEDSTETTEEDGAVEVEDSEESTDDEQEEEVSEEVQAELNFVERFNSVTNGSITEELLRECGNDVNVAVDKVILQRASGLIETFVNTLGKREQEVINALFEGSTVDEAYDVSVAPKPISEAELESDPELQRKVIALSRKAKGFSDKDVERLLKSITEDDLLEEANDSLREYNNSLEASENARKQKVTARTNEEKAKQKAIVDAAKTKLKTMSGFIPSVSLKPKEIEALEESMFTTYNKILKNPEAYIPMLGLFDRMGFFEGNFKKLTTPVASNTKKDLATLISKTTQKRQSGSSKTKGSDDVDDKALRRYLNL
jgi:hypothetical protein